MFTNVMSSFVLTAGLLTSAAGLVGTESIKDCCAKKLACCDPGKPCCQTPDKPGCCAKAMTCCEKDKACCTAIMACCMQGAPCCDEAKDCCGSEAKKDAGQNCCAAGKCCGQNQS